MSHWDSLKFSLQALAQPALFQRELLSVWLEDESELPERFVAAERHLVRGENVEFNPAQRQALADLHAHFKSFSGPTNAEHWGDEALASSPRWAEVRKLAAIVLDTFGWPIERPPLDVASYAEDYYERP